MKNAAIKLLLAGWLIMALAIFLEECQLEQLCRANGPCGLNKVILASRLQTGGLDKITSLNLDDINYLEKKLPGRKVSYLIWQEGSAEGNLRHVPVKILGTNYKWPAFNHMIFAKGAMWTPEAEREGQRVALIGADLATELYGSTNVIGMRIKLMDKEFLIEGILLPGTDIMNILTGDNRPAAYIPGAALCELSSTTPIREVHIEMPGGKPGDTSATISDLFSGMDKDPAIVNGSDYREARVLMEQVPKIQGLVMAMLILLAPLPIIKTQTGHLTRSIRKSSRDYGMSEVINRHWRESAWYLGLLAGWLLMIGLIWQRVHFSLYIPPRYLPDELTNISFFVEVIKQDIAAGQKMIIEYFQPGTGLQLSLVRITNRFLYYIAWPLGLGLVLYAWPQLNRKGRES